MNKPDDLLKGRVLKCYAQRQGTGDIAKRNTGLKPRPLR